jgi:DNA-directed RNA polymerase subunit K/omega
MNCPELPKGDENPNPRPVVIAYTEMSSKVVKQKQPGEVAEGLYY